MKAILVDANQNLNYTDVPDPSPRDDEALVEIYAAGVNRADLMQRAGHYPPPPGAPEWMGLEISGVIRALGAKAAQTGKWRVGDEVCALLGGGGYAQYAAVPEDMLMPIPKGVTMTEAAALPEAFATSYLNLFLEAKMKRGENLLVTAGNSGLASVAIPLAKAFGIRVVTTVRGAAKAQAIAHLGADLVVDTLAQPLCEALAQEEAKGFPIDVALDCLGGAEVGKALGHMRRGGRWIMIATLAGDETQIDLRQLYKKGARLIGSTLRSRPPETKARILADLVKKVWPKVERGQVRPTIDRVFPIERAEEAHALLQESKSAGKVVLTVRG